MKFDFKDKKFMITAGTAAVVVLGVFIGVKVMMNADAKASLAKASSGTEKQITDDENAIADSLKQKAEEDNVKKDEENKQTGTEGEESKAKDPTEETKTDGEGTKTSDEGKAKTTENDKDKTDNKTNSQTSESADSTVKVVKVYDDQYIVKKGDTLYTIGKKFFVDEELADGINTMKKINNIGTSDLIKDGDKLYIPIGKNFDKKTSEVMGNNYRSYIVKKGDTLTDIVKEEMEWCDVNTGLKLLREANNMTKDTIKENQKLVIPTQK